MKQRITVEQLQELTPEQREKLREWWKPEEYDLAVVNGAIRGCYDDGEYTCFDFITKEFRKDSGCNITGPAYPLLSIGQCTEILSSKSTVFNNEKCFYETLEPELIDALWGAIKEVL